MAHLFDCVSCWDGLFIFSYRAPSFISAAEDITDLTICAILMLVPFFGVSGESLDMKKWPPALILEFFSDSVEALMCTASIMPLD